MHANSNRTAPAPAQAGALRVATSAPASPSSPRLGAGASLSGAPVTWLTAVALVAAERSARLGDAEIAAGETVEGRAPLERADGPRAPRDVVLRMIAHDLRRLARDLDLLGESDKLPARLAALVTAVMEAVGRPAPALELAPIVDAVCAAFRVTHDEIVSRRRGQHVALARQVAIYLIREITGYSFPRIGGYFGRDHSTAIHSHTRIARRVAAEAPFRALLEELKEPLAAQNATHERPPGAAQGGPPGKRNRVTDQSRNPTKEFCL